MHGATICLLALLRLLSIDAACSLLCHVSAYMWVCNMQRQDSDSAYVVRTASRKPMYTGPPGLLPAAGVLKQRQVNGSSKWRLLDLAGRKVSDRKRDLDSLLDHLNIDATNPLAVLTQVRRECALLLLLWLSLYGLTEP
jgi:hypothetical protein